MIKQMFALGSALVLSTFLSVGCADSVVDPMTSTSTTASDPYVLLKLNEAEVNDFSEVPTFLEVCPPDSSSDSTDHSDDSTHREGHRGGPLGRGPRHGGPVHGGPRDSADTARPQGDSGREWMGRGEGRDFGRLSTHGYGHIFQEMKLTAEQDSLVRIYAAEFRSCAEGDYATYNAARKAAFDVLKAGVEEIRATVEAGTVTRDVAKVQIQALVDTYRAEITPLNAALKAAVDACRATFDASIEAILTADQLVIWNARK